MYVCVCVYGYTWRPDNNLGCHSSRYCLSCFLETRLLSFTWSLLIWLGWLLPPCPMCGCVYLSVCVGKRLTLGVILKELSLLFWGKEFLVDLESTIQLGWLANEPGSFIWLLEMELGPKPSFLMYIVLLSI